jgi:predicted Zn finger-like uncharacterized protein
MEIRCPHCGREQAVDDKEIGLGEKVEISCRDCGESVAAANPRLATLRVETTRSSFPPESVEYSQEGRPLVLPQDKKISLKVLEGNEAGTVFAVAKPRITIGRSNVDIVIRDRVVSRRHCALEVSEDSVLLRDLGSTNGTIVGSQLVQTAILTSGSTFRIGMNIFQLMITSEAEA